MNVRALIPKNVCDESGIEKLKQLSFNQIQPIVPDLLEWLQDCNWPVARSILEILRPLVDQITPEILEVLNGNDGVWKYWILQNLILKTTNPILLKEINRIASFPTSEEKEQELDLIAVDILRENYR
ncbi:DUF5071 domain-containing protein [Flavobacterium hungaricum]|uniref:DUF5071 domain-containing protein n=1 Tax=Flavobacterium hungaricum TaxID=2082725 RepID=A0ABR9TTV6_9FLAO|nr:DUF5071 domain-containing protein [Flavobacterium hungaricum]MBE8728077.1 DUF5071 domain-containing protein [Flavobacterium hungaricum]